MIHEKLYTKKELDLEKWSGSVTKYINMLEHNNRLLDERLSSALGFLELQEGHMRDGVVFGWREALIEQ